MKKLDLSKRSVFFNYYLLANEISPYLISFFLLRNEFSEINKRAIDEIWYKRAVEHHFVDPNSFVFSVPFDAANKNETLVTASHAIFHKENGKSAPAAVVGFQFQLSAMTATFRNKTNGCSDPSCPNCDLECFVLDENGYVVVSNELSDVGKFFGEVRGSSMRKLITDNVYQEVKIYDYQSICFINKDSASLATRLAAVKILFKFVKLLVTFFMTQLQPFMFLWGLVKVIATHMFWLYLSILLDNAHSYDQMDDLGE